MFVNEQQENHFPSHWSHRFHVSYLFFSLIFFSYFLHESTWEKIRVETELGGEREEVIEFHRDASLQANKKAVKFFFKQQTLHIT